jgi:hypothetical protein
LKQFANELGTLENEYLRAYEQEGSENEPAQTDIEKVLKELN